MANRDKIISKFNSREKTKRKLDDRQAAGRKKIRDRKQRISIREGKFADLED